MPNHRFGALKAVSFWSLMDLFLKHCIPFFFVFVQIQQLWKHLHQTQWQSGQDTFKLLVRLPNQQTEGQHFSVASVFQSDLLQARHQGAFQKIGDYDSILASPPSCGAMSLALLSVL